MSRFECVPNFSEGRDSSRIDRIANAARGTPGVAVVDVESNPDHHRCVITLVGEGEPLLSAVLAMMRIATDEIDLNVHRGEHPRMGAIDVVPFVPLANSSMEEATALAVRLGEQVWQELRIPVYLYGRAARRPERADLAVVRAGGFEKVREEISTNPERAPDIGEPRIHPTAGAVAIGSRSVLVAYNADLATSDLAVAKAIAHKVRARDGGLPEVKALGFDLKERNRVQVSMNLTDVRVTPPHVALEAVRAQARSLGTEVVSTEVVGLLPEDALLDAAEFYLKLERFDRRQILERRVAESVSASEDEPFGSFLDRLAARTPTPGGGSAAAAAAGLGVALAEMVLRYSSSTDGPPPAEAQVITELGKARRALVQLIADDAAAYDAVRISRRKLRASPDDPGARKVWLDALNHAAEVPLRTAQLSAQASAVLTNHKGKTNPTLDSDLTSAEALLQAARTAALANVATNLADLKNAGAETTALEAEFGRLRETS